VANFYNKQSGGGFQKRGGFGGGGGGGGRGFGGGGSFGGGQKEMFNTVCNECGNACEVPFRPNGKKPVFCRDCFRKEEGLGEAPRYGAREFDDRPRAFASRPERPSAPAPRPPAPGNDEVVRQLKQLNEKMDELLDALATFVEAGQEEGFEDMDEEDVEDEETLDLDGETPEETESEVS